MVVATNTIGSCCFDSMVISPSSLSSSSFALVDCIADFDFGRNRGSVAIQQDFVSSKMRLRSCSMVDRVPVMMVRYLRKIVMTG